MKEAASSSSWARSKGHNVAPLWDTIGQDHPSTPPIQEQGIDWHPDLSFEPALQRLNSRACGRMNQDPGHQYYLDKAPSLIWLYVGASKLMHLSQEAVKVTDQSLP